MKRHESEGNAACDPPSTSFLSTHSRNKLHFFVVWWKAVESNICNFGIFDGVCFLFLAVCTVVGTTVIFWHFQAKSSVIFPCMSLSFMLMDLLVSGPSGNTNIVYYKVDGILLQSYLLLAIFKDELHANMCELSK